MITKNLASKLLLVVILAGCITGLIIVTIQNCNDNESYTARVKNVDVDNSRVGNLKQGENAIKQNACNKVSKTWLENSTPDSIKNLTIKKDGNFYMCNRSCPPTISKPLTANSLSLGVM